MPYFLFKFSVNHCRGSLIFRERHSVFKAVCMSKENKVSHKNVAGNLTKELSVLSLIL